MPDTVSLYHPREDTPYLKCRARIQPRRNPGQRDVMGHDIRQEQFVQFQIPLEHASTGIKVDDTVVIASCAGNPDLVGRSGEVVDLLNGSYIIEFTFGAWFDMQRKKRIVG